MSEPSSSVTGSVSSTTSGANNNIRSHVESALHSNPRLTAPQCLFKILRESDILKESDDLATWCFSPDFHPDLIMSSSQHSQHQGNTNSNTDDSLSTFYPTQKFRNLVNSFKSSTAPSKQSKDIVGGSREKLATSMKMMSDNKFTTFAGMNLNGGKKGYRTSQINKPGEKPQEPADWPEWFVSGASIEDIRGENLEWGNRSNDASRAKNKKGNNKKSNRGKETVISSGSTSSPTSASKPEDTIAPLQEELSPQLQEEKDMLLIWLIDAYRMRSHDDLQWRGGIHRGIYATQEYGAPANNQEQFQLEVSKDFFFFLKLVELYEFYPTDKDNLNVLGFFPFDFEKLLLNFAVKLIPKRFQKDHAKFKYGDENAMMPDRPSLRRFAEGVYRCSIMQQCEDSMNRTELGLPDTGEFYNPIPHKYDKKHHYPKEVVELWGEVERYFDRAIICSQSELNVLSQNDLNSIHLLFSDVGGLTIWRKFYQSLDLQRDNFGLPHVLHCDNNTPIGSTCMIKNLQNKTTTVQPNGLRPYDYNGALGTLTKVMPKDEGKDQRFMIVANDGAQLSVKAENIEVHIEKVGSQMSAYARMHLHNAGYSFLPADVGGYSSLSDEDEESESEEESVGNNKSPRNKKAFASQNQKNANKNRQNTKQNNKPWRGLLNIGEARRVEEGDGKRRPAANRIYQFDGEDENEEIVGSVVSITGLVKAAHYNGRRGKVLGRVESIGSSSVASSSAGDEDCRFQVELLPEFLEDTEDHMGDQKEKNPTLLSIKKGNMRFVDAREEWEKFGLEKKMKEQILEDVAPKRKISPEKKDGKTGKKKGREVSGKTVIEPKKKEQIPIDDIALETLEELIVEILETQASTKLGVVGERRNPTPQKLFNFLQKEITENQKVLYGDLDLEKIKTMVVMNTKPNSKTQKNMQRKQGWERHWLVRFHGLRVMQRTGRAPGGKKVGEDGKMGFFYDVRKNVFGMGSEAPVVEEGIDADVDDEDDEEEEEGEDVEVDHVGDGADGARILGDGAPPEDEQLNPVLQESENKDIRVKIVDENPISREEKHGHFSPPARVEVVEEVKEVLSPTPGMMSHEEEEESPEDESPEDVDIQARPASEIQVETKEPRGDFSKISHVEDSNQQNQKQLLKQQQQKFRPELFVHRFYGIVTGSIFFISPRELYFTQDSIRATFKCDGDNNNTSNGYDTSTGGSSSDSSTSAHRKDATSYGKKTKSSSKHTTIRDMLDAMLSHKMRKREVEMMDIVYHEGYYYSTSNRRL